MELASVGKGILIGLGVLGLMGVGLTLGIHFFHAHLSVACLATSLGVSGSVAVAGWGGLALCISALRKRELTRELVKHSLEEVQTGSQQRDEKTWENLKQVLEKVQTGSQQIGDNIYCLAADDLEGLRKEMPSLSDLMDISSLALSQTLHNKSSLTLEETQNLTEIYSEILGAMSYIEHELKTDGLESSVCPLVEFDRKTCHDCLDKFIDKLKGVANSIEFQAERTVRGLVDESMVKGIFGDIFRGNQLILPNGEEVIPQDVWANLVDYKPDEAKFDEEMARLKKMMTPVATSVTGEQNAEDELTKKNLEDCLLKLKKHSSENGDSGTQTQVAEAIIEALHQYFPEKVENVPGLDSVHAIDILFCQASGNDLQSFGMSALSKLDNKRVRNHACADLSKQTITSWFEVASQDGSDGIRVEARYDLKKVKHDHISKLSWQGQLSIETIAQRDFVDTRTKLFREFVDERSAGTISKETQDKWGGKFGGAQASVGDARHWLSEAVQAKLFRNMFDVIENRGGSLSLTMDLSNQLQAQVLKNQLIDDIERSLRIVPEQAQKDKELVGPRLWHEIKADETKYHEEFWKAADSPEAMTLYLRDRYKHMKVMRKEEELLLVNQVVHQGLMAPLLSSGAHLYKAPGQKVPFQMVLDLNKDLFYGVINWKVGDETIEWRIDYTLEENYKDTVVVTIKAISSGHPSANVEVEDPVEAVVEVEVIEGDIESNHPAAYQGHLKVLTKLASVNVSSKSIDSRDIKGLIGNEITQLQPKQKLQVINYYLENCGLTEWPEVDKWLNKQRYKWQSA